MKTVLLITYYFSSIAGIGGIRPHGLAKYLPRYDWKVIVLTTILSGIPDSNLHVIQTPFDDIIKLWKERFGLNPEKSLNAQFSVLVKENKNSLGNKFLSIPSDIISYPDPMKGWNKYAISAAEEIIKSEKIDAIISSSSPVTCHLIANHLVKKYNIPWIADLRDLWTQNHDYQYSKLRKIIEKRLELSVLKNTSAMITVSDPWKNKLAEIHKGKKIFTIRNGYDPDIFNPGVPISKKFSIIYAGALYHKYRDPEILLMALNDLIVNNKINSELLSIDFYITDQNWLIEDIKKYNLETIVHIHQPISREKILKKIWESQLLLILSWNDPNEKGQIPAKIFEYLAARRPIISIGKYDSGELKRILERTNAGVELTEKEDIKRVLMDAYNEFLQTGVVSYHGIQSEIEKYSQIEMARKFGEILDNFI